MQEHLFFIDYLVRILEENWHMIYIPYDQIWLVDQTHDQTLPTSLSKALQWGDSNCLTAEYQHILMLPKDPESNITSTLDLLKIICLIVFFVPILLFVTLLAFSRSKRYVFARYRTIWREHGLLPFAATDGFPRGAATVQRSEAELERHEQRRRGSKCHDDIASESGEEAEGRHRLAVFFLGGLRFKWISGSWKCVILSKPNRWKSIRMTKISTISRIIMIRCGKAW